MVLPEGHRTAFWAIPIFNCTPLWMTINGVQDLNACTGRLEGILNRSLSRGGSMQQNTSLSRGTFTSQSKVGAGPWGWWRCNKCYIVPWGGYVILGVKWRGWGNANHSPVVRWLTCTLHPWQTNHESQLLWLNIITTARCIQWFQLRAILLTAFMLD